MLLWQFILCQKRINHEPKLWENRERSFQLCAEGAKIVNGGKITYVIDGTIKASGVDNSGGTTSVKDPIAGTDAVNLAYLQKKL